MDIPLINTLLVEDNPGDAFTTRKMLSAPGPFQIQLTHVVRLSEALAHLAQHAYDVILLDLSLPDSFSLDSVLAFQKHGYSLPIVVLTGAHDETMGIAAVQQGAQDYLLKDQVNSALLIRAIRYAIERHHIEVNLKQRTLQLETANQQLEQLNTQLGTTNKVLAQRTSELEAANAELSAFGYTVSHDLRNPLASLKGFGELLKFQYANQLDSQGQNYIQRILHNAERMAQLITDILHLSQVSSSQLYYQEVDLSAMVQDILHQKQRAESTRQLELEIMANVSTEGDPDLIRIGLENLLGNAWKYTRKTANACIEFGVQSPPASDPPLGTLDPDSNSSHLSQDRIKAPPIYFVRDNGVGFDMDKVDQLFIPFERLHTKQEFEGTGIGLATVERIIHRHGGQIWAEAAVGKGATFFFTLSRKQSLLPTAESIL